MTAPMSVMRPGWRPPPPPPRVTVSTTDLAVVTAAWSYAAATTTSLGAEDACRAVVAPFTGVEMAAACLQAPGSSLRELLAVCTAIPTTATAIGARGALLVNSAGRCGVVVAAGRVVQPCGRSYALTTTTAAWWTSGWWAGTVAVTVPPIGPVVPGQGQVPWHPPWPHLYPDAGVYPDTGRTVGDGSGSVPSTPLHMYPDTGVYPDTGHTSGG